MSQSCQNLVRFPSTRHMNADYGSVLPNHSSGLQPVVDKGDCCRLVAPHQVVSRSFSGSKSLSERIDAVKKALLMQVSSLERSIAYQEQKMVGAEPVVKRLLQSAKQDPASTASSLCCRNGVTLTGVRQRKVLLCARGKDCGKRTLPFSKYCLQHQCSNRQQLLYPICSGIDNNSLMKCNGTVLDIFSDTSLCSQHSSETAANASFRKKALYLQSRAAHKKVKLGVAKVVRDRKGQVKLKLKADGSSSDFDGKSTAGADEAAATKPVPASKSLDDLLSLGSSLTATLPKLDLLPLKADIGEIMMAGEDSSGEDMA